MGRADMSNQWFRMYAEFATDPKVQALSEALQRRYAMLLCLKCNGDLKNITERNGEIALCVIAAALRITHEEAASTKKILIDFGFIDESWNIHGWEKRQYITDLTDPTNAERQKRYRERNRNAPVTLKKRPDTDTDTDTEKKEIEVATAPQKPKSEKIRGTRLTKDWTLPQEWGEWAETQGLSGDEIIRQGQKFRNHWISKAGASAAKLDWYATWQNWIFQHLEGFKK